MSSADQSETFLNSESLSDEFFISIVENKLKVPRESFKIRLVLLSPATGSNENFVSVIYRAKIKVQLLETNENKSVDVIIKALLTTLEEFKEFSVFPRERFMYEDIIKSFEEIWLDRANEVVHFGPQCVRVETDPYEIIVLDDLKANGYKMLDRKVGLTELETKAVLSKIAKFHAAGAVRYQKDGNIKNFLVLKNSFPDEWTNPEAESAKSFIAMYDGFIERVRTYGDCDDYIDKIAKWDKKKFLQCFVLASEPMRCGFKILSHGDLWINNMMFKFNATDEVEDVSFLDFQICGWASPAIDLHYFMVSSVHDDVKVKCYDELMKFYHEELCESLRKLKYDQHIPTLDEFYEDLREKGGLAAQSTLNIMIVTKYESSEVLKMEDFITCHEKQDESLLDRLYCNDIFKKAIKIWLPFMDERGYLDALLPDELMQKS